MLVVKIGGAEGIDYDAIADDVAALVKGGQRLVVVHGGSALTNQVATALGHPPQFVTSASGYTSRRTDRRTLEIFEMVYCGQMNKGLVERLQRRGVNAVGLSGLDGRLWQGPRKTPSPSSSRGGGGCCATTTPAGWSRSTPPCSPRCSTPATRRSLPRRPSLLRARPSTWTATGAAAATAIALRAEALVILSNVPGLLERFPDEASLIRRIPADRLEAFMAVARTG